MKNEKRKHGRILKRTERERIKNLKMGTTRGGTGNENAIDIDGVWRRG
jgi:hypothetical protein